MDYANFNDIKSIFVYLVLIIGVQILLYRGRFVFSRFFMYAFSVIYDTCLDVISIE
jgi:hypothetical protein